MKIFCLFIILSTSNFSIFAQIEDTTIMKKIEFVNIDSKKLKTEILGIVDESVRLNGDFGVYGNLSIGIEKILKENYITVTNKASKIIP